MPAVQLQLSGSPVVATNRAIALAELQTPTAALNALDGVVEDPRLLEYQPYWAARRFLQQRRAELGD